MTATPGPREIAAAWQALEGHPAYPRLRALAEQRAAERKAEGMTPEQIAAIVRQAADGTGDRYPAKIGVFCDGCGVTAEHDYIVSDDMDQAARFAVARRYLAKAEDWSCDHLGDYCPRCSPPLT